MLLACVLSFLGVSEFLLSCGTRLQEHPSLTLTEMQRAGVLAALQKEV